MGLIFWIFWGIDALVASIFVYFFMIGIGDGTVSLVNIVLWLGILGGLGVILGGSLWLRSLKQRGLALGLLLILAVPALFGLLILLATSISNPNWH